MTLGISCTTCKREYDENITCEFHALNYTNMTTKIKQLDHYCHDCLIPEVFVPNMYCFHCRYKDIRPCWPLKTTIIKNKLSAYFLHCSLDCCNSTKKFLKKRTKFDLDKQLNGVCHTCKKTQPKMTMCGKCKYTNYCSRECQKLDWKEHKNICMDVNK